MADKKIVLVEDEPDIQDVVRYNLEREGFGVHSALDGEEGLALIRSKKPNLVVLDLMLPGIDGLEICRQLKKDPQTEEIPIVIVTAKGEESDVILGLGMGADDYIAKPFSPKVLVARVKAVLRRREAYASSKVQSKTVIKGITIDSVKHEVTVDGTPIEFTASEFRLLHFLASHAGRVFTREQILNHVVGEGNFVVDRNIDVHVRMIRKKLGVYRDIIKTIRGIGYRMDEDRGSE